MVVSGRRKYPAHAFLVVFYLMNADVVPSRTQGDPLTHAIIGCGISVHRALGPGLLESAYEQCLSYELVKCGFAIKRQFPLPLVYDGVHVELGFRPDIIVNDQVILEVKTVSKLLPIHDAQLLTYLRLSGLSTGLLMNFHSNPLTSGIKRLVLTNPT